MEAGLILGRYTLQNLYTVQILQNISSCRQRSYRQQSYYQHER